MSKEMIISVNGREKKIAILDGGKVTEFYIERGDEENSGVVGNIYKGRVMRVLPGMQSAFVDIGLERDAFLYVTDFFDEEEEIERIVMEKSKKVSPEEAKREANDQIDRQRIEREKQMEAVQEIAEPLSETLTEEPLFESPESSQMFEKIEDAPESEVSVNEAPEAQPQPQGKGKNQRRGKRERAEARGANTAQTPDNAPKAGTMQLEDQADSSFERIVDEDETVGDLFKDAYVQETLTDQVRAIEFDMESVAEAEVGSVLNASSAESHGFERIADEDEEPSTPAQSPNKSRGGKSKNKSGKAKNPNQTETAAQPVEANDQNTENKKSGGRKGAKPKSADVAETAEIPTFGVGGEASEDKPAKGKKSSSRRSKKSGDQLADAEASVKDSGDKAEMAVRRGGRGRRRGGRGTANEHTDDTAGNFDNSENIETDANEFPHFAANEQEFEAVVSQPQETAAPPVEREAPPSRQRNSQDNQRRDNREPRENRDNRDNRNQPNRDTRGKDAPRNNSENRDTRDARPSRDNRDNRDSRRSQPTITDLLREGQEVLVQIAKEPIARKGARITSHIALPGRFLVYMPTIEHLGVSRKIESSSERARLRTLIQSIKREEDVPNGGFIVRTAGIGISDEDLRQDARYLVRTWQDIRKSSERKKSPTLVHQDLDIIQRLLRDHLSDEYTAIRVDSEEEYLRIVEFINRIQPKMVNRVKLYTRETPILEAYNVQEEVDKALKPRVWLKSGGYLVINQTEALVAIDVNTGKFVGRGNARLEDTITKTNMEAVDEIARQIRLRDLGGIIVLDLIDMEDRRNRNKVSQALQEALSTDKSPTKVLSFNDFGLIIMTRKRVKQSLERTLCTPCEYCESSGWVKSPQTICYEILEESRRLSKAMDDVKQTTLRVHSGVAEALRTDHALMEEIEAYLGNVDITADPHVHQAQFDFAFV